MSAQGALPNSPPGTTTIVATLCVALTVTGFACSFLDRFPVELAAFACVGVLVLLLAIERPDLAFFAILLLLPFDREKHVGAAGGFSVHASDVLIVALACVCFIKHRRTLREGLDNPLVGALACLAGWIVLGTLWSRSGADALRVAKDWLVYFAFFVVAASMLGTERRRSRFLAVVLAGGLIVLFAGVGEIVTGAHVLGKYEARLLPAAGLGGALHRIAGPWMHPNRLAAHCMILLSVSLAIVVSGAKAARRLAWAVVLLAPFVLVFTQSLSGLAGAAGVLGAFCLLTPRDVRRRFVKVMGTLVAAAVAVNLVLLLFSASGPALILGKLASLTGSRGGGRLWVWQATLQLWGRSPFIGLGTGSFQEAMANSGLMWPSWIPTHAHNTYLHVLSEWGLAGLALLGWLAGAVLANYAAKFRTLTEPTRQAALWAGTFSFVGLLFIGGGETFIVWHGIFLLAVALLGLASTVTGESTAPAVPAVGPAAAEHS